MLSEQVGLQVERFLFTHFAEINSFQNGGVNNCRKILSLTFKYSFIALNNFCRFFITLNTAQIAFLGRMIKIPEISSNKTQNDCCRNKMRFSTKRCLIIFILLIVSILTWNILSKQYEENYTQTCNQLGKYQEELHIFTDRVHKILQALNLTHFLCYGSLWGQIRLSRLLPWEDKSVMCLLNEDISEKDEVLVARMFKKEGIYISYDTTEGQYVVTQINGDAKMRVILIVFEMNHVVHMYRRIGWIRRLLPPACEQLEILDCFPPRLITPPLPMKEFGKSLLPVPREGIELQKYHYKDNWWKEITIKNC